MKTLRYILFVLFGVLMASCSSDDDDSIGPNTDVPNTNEKGLTLNLTRAVIQANGEDATDFIVRMDGKVLKSGFTVYDENDQPVKNTKNYTTTKVGTYKFWASYGTHHTDLITLKAIDIPVPALPADANPEKLNFQKKVLMTKFTGTACGFCPGMSTVVLSVLEDTAYANKVILADAHTFNHTDPCYLSNGAQLAQFFGVAAYPTMIVDFSKSFSNGNYFGEKFVRQQITEAYRIPAVTGICAKAEMTKNAEGKDLIALHVAVKAAEDGEYRVGAMLLEDGIKARQTGVGPDSPLNTHNNAIRIIDCEYKKNNFSGIELGKITKGKTAEHVFIMELEEKWVTDNCHLVIFVNKKGQMGAYGVNNAVACPVKGTLNYSYTY